MNGEVTASTPTLDISHSTTHGAVEISTASPNANQNGVTLVTQNNTNQNDRGHWGGKTEFLLSAIGYAVGLGNIWRFPHLCYKNGGGAFLIPYIFMLTFAGLPLFYLELAFGQYASLGPFTIWRISPLFKGIGYAMVVMSMMVSIYYNVIIGYTLFYFFASFTKTLPWSLCGQPWNTDRCSATRGMVNVTNASGVISEQQSATPAEEYWDFFVQGLTPDHADIDISNLGGVRWHLCLCLLLAWIIVFLCIIKGIKSSGKVVYFTAIFPYVMLFILFIRGVSLPGADLGIIYYLKPDFEKMKQAKVWHDAAVQILYSLGPGFGGLLTMASYNKFHNKCNRDAVIVTVVNCGTSIFAGFVIFSVLGFMAQKHGVDIEHVVKSGPGLAFVVYPEAIALIPGAPFWSICFFFMLFTLGLDSQFAGMECIVSAFVDEYEVIRKHKLVFTASLCVLLFFLGIPCVTQGGVFMLTLMDKFSAGLSLLVVTSLECIVISWVYGFWKFAADIKLMIGIKPNYFWIGCWAIVTPAIVVVIFVVSAVEFSHKPFKHQDYVYPDWAKRLGLLMASASIVMIPIWMIIQLARHVQSFQNLWNIIRSPSELRSLQLAALVKPTDRWGPAYEENRLQHAQETLPDLQPSDEMANFVSAGAQYGMANDSYI